MIDNPQEKRIEAFAVKIGKQYGLVAIKLNIMGRRGWPDRMFIGPKRVLFFIEFKRKGNVPTKLQEATIALIRKWGFNVYVVDNYEDAKYAIETEVRAT